MAIQAALLHNEDSTSRFSASLPTRYRGMDGIGLKASTLDQNESKDLTEEQDGLPDSRVGGLTRRTFIVSSDINAVLYV